MLTPLQKLPKNVRDLGKLIVATGFEKLPKVQKITQSGHTGSFVRRVSTKIVIQYDCEKIAKILSRPKPVEVDSRRAAAF